MTTPKLPSQHAASPWLRSTLRALSAVSPTCAGRVGADLFCTPRKRRVRPAERALLDRAREVVVRSRGIELVVHVWGSEPLVLLHHGWNGNAAQMTAFVPALLERGLGVAALDAAAHGRSGGRRNNLVWMSADAVAVARELEPVAFLGHSMGAVVGVRACHAGVALARLVLVAPPAEFEPYFVAFARAVGLSDRAYVCMVEHFGARLATHYDELTSEWLTQEPLPPALIVHDADDDDAPSAHAQRWLDRWPAPVQELRTEGLGHRALLRDAAVIERAAEFLGALR